MKRKPGELGNLLNELKRRKVIHVITVYAAIAFVILQLVDLVAEPLRLPVSTKALVIVLLCIGFVIAVFLSWVYDITPTGVKKTKPVSAVKHIDQTTISISSGWKIATYVSIALIITLIAFNFIKKRNLNADFSKLEKSIAVLPFINDSPSDSNQYFINGLMDEILNNLQKIGAFSKVPSRTSTEQYRGITKPPIPKIAKDLDVNFIVEGSGQKYGNFYRIRVQLIEGKTDKHLWVNSYEREIRETKDIYGIQSQIAQSIAAELKTVITPEEKQLIEKTPTMSLTAYDFYQRGREEHEKYWLDNKNNASLKKAENLYNKSLEYDPKFAAAYTGLAFVYWNKHVSEEYFSKNYLDSVMILCDIAISYDSQLAEAHYIKGQYYREINKPEQSVKEYDKALELNPNDWWSYVGRGDLYFYYYNDIVQALYNFHKAISLYRGSFLPGIFNRMSYAYSGAGFIEEAKHYCNEAFRLDGDSLGYYYLLSDIEGAAGNNENSVKLLQKAYTLDSANLGILYGLGDGFMRIGKPEEALRYFKKCLENGIGQDFSLIFAGLYVYIGWSYLQIGDKEKAEYYISKQIGYTNKQIEIGRMTNIESQKYGVLADVYALRGEKDKVYKNLRNISQMKIINFATVTLLKFDPLLVSLRKEPEFQQIVRDVEAKYQAEHERVSKWLAEKGEL
jgi:TolB-like protein/Tfp pilus assembly protein PilF